MLGEIFDPKAETLIHDHWRPHWSQSGVVVFIAFRTHDSIPRDVIRRWENEKRQWLRARGYDHQRHWKEVVASLPAQTQAEFKRTFDRCREDYLDTCHGRCLLKQPMLAQIVADTLFHFDGERYKLGDFVIMPNHVHLLAAFVKAEELKAQCDSWLHYSATQINRAIGEKGKFWQQEPFDHLVRSPEQYEYLRECIARNPQKAGLRAGEFIYRRYDEK